MPDLQPWGNAMSYEFYKIVHIFAALFMMLGLGGYVLHGLNGGTKETNEHRKMLGMTHGISLLVMFVAGFGLIAKLGVGFPGWVIAKLVVWMLFGASIKLIGARPDLAKPLFFALPVLGGIAAWLAVAKPF